MGKLEKFGRSILRKLGGSRRRRGDVINATASSSTSSGSSDEETMTLTPQTASRSLPDYVHRFQVVPPDEEPHQPLETVVPDHRPIRMGSPAASEEGSAGYATDDTALSSLSPLDVKRTSVDYSESQGYYSTAELSPIPRIVLEEAPEVPELKYEPQELFAPEAPEVTPRTPLFKKNSQEYPRINVSKRFKSSLALSPDDSEVHLIPIHPIIDKRKSATLSNLADPEEQDPIERFLKSSIYKTKMITTVFEAKDGGFEEICTDVMHEIDRWFETKNMMAVACEMHWSVPREKRKRQLESKLKDKLLNALRENNKRLLYLRGMGRGKTPVKLAESKTVENISRDRDTDSVRGIYQRSYTHLLPYLHKETPEWHSQYWTLQDLQDDSENLESSIPSRIQNPVLPDPQHFLFNSESPDVLSKNSLISLNIIGLSILGNSRKSCGSLFEQGF